MVNYLRSYGGRAHTELIAQWRDGDGAALDALTPPLYDNLRQIASRHMARENSWHTLSPTAVVHEAYMRLQGYQCGPLDRGHFSGLGGARNAAGIGRLCARA